MSKKTLGEILRVLCAAPFAAKERINWSPIDAAELLECSLCYRRLALGSQHHTPMSCDKRRRAGIDALAGGGSVHGETLSLHSRKPQKIKPAFERVARLLLLLAIISPAHDVDSEDSALVTRE